MSPQTRFPRFPVAGGLELVPPTLMIVTRHPVMGAVTLGAVLVAWVVHVRMVVRAQQARDARLLDFAQTTTNLGADPAPVISALRHRAPREVADDELFDPDEPERPWVHLRPSDW